MAKDTFHFSHDYNARNDDKIKLLLRKLKWEGYGLFWAIVEDLYNNANSLLLDYDGMAYDLRADVDLIKSIINDFDLFVIENGKFGSISIEKRLDERNAKSKTAKENAHARWSKKSLQCKVDAIASKIDAKKTELDANAYKIDADALKNDADAPKIDAIKKHYKERSIINKETENENIVVDDDIPISEKTIRKQYDKFLLTDSAQKEQMAMNNKMTKRQIDIACIGFVISLMESGKYEINSIYPDFNKHFRNWFYKYGKYNLHEVPKARIEMEFKTKKINEYTTKYDL